MKIIKSEQIICVDIDDTLVLWNKKIKIKSILVKDPYMNKFIKVKPHYAHIQLLKEKKLRGYTIIVWSQGGYKWAETIVKVLKLESYVDLILSKPLAIIDDLPASKWLGERIYIKPNSAYKQL